MAAGTRKDDGLRMFVSQFAALSIFNLSYRIDAKGEPTPEDTRNFWDTISISYFDIKPKDKKKGQQKVSFKVKKIAGKVQELMNAFTSS